ncbi:MAG: sensor histidine kinase [Bacteroidetes bacterium]|nr:sensor histidine kinase [Bacteroidota bacterium]
MRRIIAALIFLVSNPLFGQNQKLIDSLERKLAGAKEDSNKVNILNDIAFEYRLVNEAKAYRLLHESVKLAEKIGFKDGLALAYNHFGILYKNRQMFDSSLYYHHKAFAIWNQMNDEEGMASSYNNQGRTYQAKTDYTNAIDCYLKSLKLREKIKDTTGAAAAYSNIGQLYGMKKDLNKAKEYTAKSVELLAAVGDSFALGKNILALGYFYYEGNQFDTALVFYKRALILFKAAHAGSETAQALNNIGNALAESNRSAESIPYQLEALKIQTEIADTTGMFTSELSLCQAYGFDKQYELAARFGQQALDLLKKAGGEVKMYMDTYEVLSELYRKKQDYKKAIETYTLYNHFKDSLIKEENSRITSDMLAKYESDKKDLELKNAAYKLQRRKLIIGGLAAVIALLVMSGYLLYNRYKLKKRRELDEALIRQQEIRNKAIIEAEERERVRIAKDLHDGVGQQLAAVKLSMNAMEEELAADAGKLERIKALEHMVDETLKEVRTVSHNMMPNALIRKGLAAAVREFIDNIAATGLLKVDLQIIGLNERLDGSMETVLYRVLQEVVSNIIKHAQANKVSIQLIRHDDGYLNFIIEDNGKGFNVSEANNFNGIGLKNIMSRIQYLNGSVDFDSAVGRGTTVVIEVPLIVA